MTPSDITIEELLRQASQVPVGYNKDIVMTNGLSDMRLFSHPARLKATTVLICLSGVIDCSINLKRFIIAENQILINFSSDIIQIHQADNVTGYAVLLSDDYLNQLQLDFRLRVQSYIGLRGNGPITVSYDELLYLKPYYTLLKKNIEDDNYDVIKGLTVALSHTILTMVGKNRKDLIAVKEFSRAQQLFDRFMSLLQEYHYNERGLQFYADKMCLTPQYLSVMIKSYSGKCALTWINEYVVLEAKMMLRYTSMTVQEISIRLNFPTQSAFGKYFKQKVGIGPKQYRIDLR